MKKKLSLKPNQKKKNLLLSINNQKLNQKKNLHRLTKLFVNPAPKLLVFVKSNLQFSLTPNLLKRSKKKNLSLYKSYLLKNLKKNPLKNPQLKKNQLKNLKNQLNRRNPYKKHQLILRFITGLKRS